MQISNNIDDTKQNNINNTGVKVLLIHNILWSHYKAGVFSALNDLCHEKGTELLVVQIAATEGSRKGIGQLDRALHRYPYKLLFDGNFESTGAIRRIVALCREIIAYRPDIVILPGYFDISFCFALFTAKLLRIPAILTFDSTAMDRPKSWYKDAIKKIFIRGCDAAFGYGTKSKEYLMALGMPTSAIFIRCQATHNSEIATIHAAAHVDRQTRLTANGFKSHNFIYVGRLSPEKNIERLIRCFVDLKSREPQAADWGLIVVGDGPQRQELIQLCAKLGVGDVNFVGGKSWREVPEFHALSDVLVLPSTSEPWGLVVNEAMVCGLPVLVSNRCGAAYDLVIEGENGFVFDPFNELQFTELLKYFVAHPEMIETMGSRSREIIAAYTPKNAALQMYSGIEHVLTREKR